MTTPIDVQNPYFVEYKTNPSASAPPCQPWNVTPGYAYPQPNISVNPQYGYSTLFHQTFLKGKPKALGIVLVVGGIVEIALGIASVYTAAAFSLISGIDFWEGIINIIAGSLTISAEPRPNICLIKGSLSLNIITAFFNFIAIILVCIDLAACSLILNNPYSEDYWRERTAEGVVVLSLLLITNLLLLSVSFSLSVFGCQALSQETTTAPQVFVVQNDVRFAMPQPPSYSN